MKRQANIQLVKGAREDGSDDEGTPEQGMKKASDAELTRRVIRPLPSRNKSSVQSDTTLTMSSTAGSSLFSSPGAPSDTSTFTGFGPKTTSTEAATFTSSTSTTNTTFVSSSSSPFSFKPSQAVPSAATSTSKAFASLLSSSGPSPFGPPAPAPVSATPTPSSPGKVEEESSSIKYYKNLRGLNLSLVTAITKAVEGDPYVDLTEALEKYKSYRSKVQVDFNDSPKTNGFPAQVPSTSTPTPSASSSTTKPTTMPAPPPSFSGFGGFKLPTPSKTSTSDLTAPPSTASNSTGFKPTNVTFGSSASSSSFSFPSESKAPGFSFGSSTSAPSLASSTAPSTVTPSASFTFGSSMSSPTPSASVFGSFGTTPSQSSSTPSNPFGMSSSQTASAFSFSKPAEKLTEKSETTGTPNPFSIPEKSTSSGFFPTPKTSTSGSLPFSFGSSSTPSVFGKTDTAPATVSEETVTEENSERGTPAAEGENSTPGLLSSNPLDEEGAGEENEETVHTVRAKAFKLSKDAEGVAKWLQLGTGMLRIKKDKDTGSRRLLLRNSTNGKVIVNFKIYSALKPTQNKAALSFIGHDDGAPQTYSIRLAKEDDAKNLKDVLDREIAFVKGKET